MVVELSWFLPGNAGEVGAILKLDAGGEEEEGLVEKSDVFVAPLADGLGKDGEEDGGLWMDGNKKQKDR